MDFTDTQKKLSVTICVVCVKKSTHTIPNTKTSYLFFVA